MGGEKHISPPEVDVRELLFAVKLVKHCARGVNLDTQEELLIYRKAEVRYRYLVYCERLRKAKLAATHAGNADRGDLSD